MIEYRIKQLLKDQNSNEENQQPLVNLAPVNELKSLDSVEGGTVSLSKYKLELEQRVNIKWEECLIGVFFSSSRLLEIFRGTFTTS